MKKSVVQALLAYAKYSLEEERCEQGRPVCGRFAPFEHLHAGYPMCSECAAGWYPMCSWEAEEDEADGSLATSIASGLVEKEGDHYVKRHESRRRDAEDANSPLSTADVDALIALNELDPETHT